jgi:hypothetical protein
LQLYFKTDFVFGTCLIILKYYCVIFNFLTPLLIFYLLINKNNNRIIKEDARNVRILTVNNKKSLHSIIITFILIDRAFGIDSVLEEAYEAERKEEQRRLAEAISGPNFSYRKLLDTDPPHYRTTEGEVLKSLKLARVPPDHAVLLDWSYAQLLKYEQNTCQEGWRYSTSFSGQFSACYQYEHMVKQRKWQRLLVPNDVLETSRIKLNEFSKYQCAFRSFHMTVVHIALRGQKHEVQMILECQRVGNDCKFSSDNLESNDPPAWSGCDSDLLGDPRVFNIVLVPVLPTIYKHKEGWELLHEFIYCVYPEVDECGWEYNTDFNFTDGWSPSITLVSTVRRRLWFRTCVPNEDIQICRSLLEAYINLHERGTVLESTLLKQDRIKTLWLDSVARLNDKNLTVTLTSLNNYQYDIPLRDCVAISMGKSYYGQQYAFGLRLATGGNDDMKIVVCTNSERERERWLGALTHQIAMANLSFWKIDGGPPSADGILLRGELSKRGHVVPNWKFRTFELRQDGVLSYFKETELLGKINIRNANITMNAEVIVITTTTGYVLMLSSKQSATRSLWFNALQEASAEQVINIDCKLEDWSNNKQTISSSSNQQTRVRLGSNNDLPDSTPVLSRSQTDRGDYRTLSSTPNQQTRDRLGSNNDLPDSTPVRGRSQTDRGVAPSHYDTKYSAKENVEDSLKSFASISIDTTRNNVTSNIVGHSTEPSQHAVADIKSDIPPTVSDNPPSRPRSVKKKGRRISLVQDDMCFIIDDDDDDDEDDDDEIFF